MKIGCASLPVYEQDILMKYTGEEATKQRKDLLGREKFCCYKSTKSRHVFWLLIRIYNYYRIDKYEDENAGN